MNKNKYLDDLDLKVNSVLAHYERGEVSQKVLEIVLGILFEKHYSKKFHKLISMNSNQDSFRSMQVSFKKITEYYHNNV